YFRSLDLDHIPLNGIRLLGSIDGARYGQVCTDMWIGINLFDVAAQSEVVHQGSVSGHLDHVHDPERLVRNAAAVKHRDQGTLRPTRDLAQRTDYIPALRILRWQGRCAR